jgi:hypothetical protein
MIATAFPELKFKTKIENGIEYIYDVVRKKYIVLTPEEWVRQNIIAYLTQVQNYTPKLIAVEKQLVINGKKRRFDLLVYNNKMEPYLLVECKQPAVELNEAALLQTLHYTQGLKPLYIFISNGNQTFGWQLVNGKTVPCTNWPNKLL